MPARFHYLVCYDIASPRRLRKVASLVLAHGERVQKSVFECELSPSERRMLMQQIRVVMDKKHDTVRLYRLCERCSRSRSVLGHGQISAQPLTYVA